MYFLQLTILGIGMLVLANLVLTYLLPTIIVVAVLAVFYTQGRFLE
jgi:hypothetical protein